MIELAVHKLRKFLEHKLHVDCSITFHMDTAFLVSDQIPFDICVYTPDLMRDLPSPRRKTIYLSETQVAHQFTKICNRIKVLSGAAEVIFARQTVCARVDKKVSVDFLDEHHIQIPLSGKYRYGLFLNGELVSLAVFSGGRQMSDKRPGYRSFELIRFCHKGDLLIVGGLSKLIAKFITEFDPDDIMTYVDLNWAQQSSLTEIDFTEVGRLPESYTWISGRRQFPVSNSIAFRQILESHPDGYLIHSRGSIKMLKYLHKAL